MPTGTEGLRERLVDVETSDALILPGALIEPVGSSDTCIVWLHGFGSGYDYRPCIELGRMLAATGVAFLTAATRGQHGAVTAWVHRTQQQWGTRKVGSWFEVLTECGVDVGAWLRVARELGYARIVLAGHSFGAVKLAYWLGTAHHDETRVAIDGLVLASPSRGIARLDPEVVSLAVEYVARGDGECLLPDGSWPRGFGTRTVSAQTMASWAEVSEVVFAQPALWQERVTAPVLAYYGDTADVGGMPELETFTGRMTHAAAIDGRILSGVRHNYDGGAATIAEAIESWWRQQYQHIAQGIGER